MSNEPSKMIRVPTPLVDAVRELARLHRAGRTQAVLKGVQRLIAAIDSDTAVNIDSVAKTISKLTERLEQLESERSDGRQDIDVASTTQLISKRLEKVEADIESIALTITDLNVRLSDLEGVGDIGYAVTPLSELELLDDISADSETTADVGEQGDIGAIAEGVGDIRCAVTSLSEPELLNNIAADAEPTAETEDSGLDIDAIAQPESAPQVQAPLTQKALAARLGTSGKTINNFQKKGKKSFAEWSRKYDPDGKAWTWEGQGGSGRPFRFLPWSTSLLP